MANKNEKIVIRGARQHNLKNINLELPRDKFIVVTGLSGSGKSSLVFDTIYAEGQRRYIESLSSYARQFLGQMDKPDVDYIGGLSPAIAIDQKNTSRNPRSTVGTVTEIYDYLRLLFARIGKPFCSCCGKPISRQSIDQITDNVFGCFPNEKIIIYSPVARGKKGEFQKILENAKKSGFLRVRIDGEVHEISEKIQLNKNKRHNIEILIDRMTVSVSNRSRLVDSLETALRFSDGIVAVAALDNSREQLYSEKFSCTDCQINMPEIEPRLFSFNNPHGACSACTGLGIKLEIDSDLVVPDKNLSLINGAVVAISRDVNSYYFRLMMAMAEYWRINLECPWGNLSGEAQEKLLWGTGDLRYKFRYTNMFGDNKEHVSAFEGIIPMLERRHKETTSDWAREEIEKFMVAKKCHACCGARLRPEALAVRIDGKNIYELTTLTAINCKNFFDKIQLNVRELTIGRRILKEISTRLDFLCNVGLNYLTLHRSAGTLSGGEAQRIRLATQIGSGLTGVLYILDEPSIGLHQRDNDRLLSTLFNLRDLGNTLIVVEHDEDTMRSADYIVDIGPAAGAAGGEVVAAGSLDEIIGNAHSITGRYLAGTEKIEMPNSRRKPDGRFIEIIEGRENNLKDISVKFPIGCFTAVTGVSGSGKSSLVNEVLYKELRKKIANSKEKFKTCRDIVGVQYVDRIIDIDQSPIGRTPRSNPATYTGLFDPVRELFSMTPEARLRGYKPGRFSFNVKGGRCENCSGDGIIKIEMHFLPDIFVPCEVCKGQRYNRETLEVTYKGYNIASVLDMTVQEAGQVFANIPKIEKKLSVLTEVGLGYIKLGQAATTLSGGEAQRIKLAFELAKRSTGKTLYILDEPTTGLHSADIKKLLLVLQKLVEAGDTVIVIEHNMDVIKVADYVVDLGPEGGDGGGELVAWGTPEEVRSNPSSVTGRYLHKILLS